MPSASLRAARRLPIAALAVLLLLTCFVSKVHSAPPAPLPLSNPLDVISYGSAKAPVTIIEYGSLTCPSCAQFDRDELVKLKQSYIDKGLVRLIFRPMSRNGVDVYAGLLVSCLQPERRTAMIETLFRQQRNWIPSGVPEDKVKDVLVTNLKGYGRTAGLSDQAVDRCLANTKNQAWLQALLAQASQDGVNGTPTFFINGKRYSNMAFEDWKKLLDPLVTKTN